jgi:hypothetical protein
MNERFVEHKNTFQERRHLALNKVNEHFFSFTDISHALITVKANTVTIRSRSTHEAPGLKP